MSNKKFQENLKRIAGIKDDQGGLDKQDVKDPIGSRRGIAYLTQGGTIATKSGTGGETVVDWDYSFDTYYDRTGYKNRTITTTKEKYTVECLKGQEGCTPPGVGDALATLDGLYDCATGDKADLNIAVDECVPPVTEINCEDVCVDPQPDPSYAQGYFWQDTGMYYQATATADSAAEEYRKANSQWEPFTNRRIIATSSWTHGPIYTYQWDILNETSVSSIEIRRWPCGASPENYCNLSEAPTICPDEIYEQQCEKYPWDDCECYHIEKRGTELKAGWDSPEQYTLPVNCVDDSANHDPTKYWWNSGYTYVTNKTVFGPTQAIVRDKMRYVVAERLTSGAIPSTGSAAVGVENYCVYLSQNNLRCYRSSDDLVVYSDTSVTQATSFCSGSTEWYCNPTPEELQLCDTYPEQCQPPTEPDDYTGGYYWQRFYSGVGFIKKATPSAVMDDYVIRQNAANAGTYYYQYSFLEDADVATKTYTVYVYRVSDNGLNSQFNTDVSRDTCGTSTEPYCNPDYSDPEDCEPYPLTQEQDCCPPQDTTTPQGCMWSSDGEVTWNWDSDSGTFKTNALDPDASQTVKSPETFNLCDQFGNPVTMRNSGGSLVIKYDPDGDGTGVTYKVGTGGTIEAIDTAAREGLY